MIKIHSSFTILVGYTNFYEGEKYPRSPSPLEVKVSLPLHCEICDILRHAVEEGKGLESHGRYVDYMQAFVARQHNYHVSESGAGKRGRKVNFA
jgi:hypothetical protein